MNQTKNHSYNAFKKLGYPSKKLENWKFSNSKHLKSYNVINQDQSDIDIKQYLAIENALCFVNGKFVKESLNNFIYKITINHYHNIKVLSAIAIYHESKAGPFDPRQTINY